jgi:Cu-Zn family superoxide dismutase
VPVAGVRAEAVLEPRSGSTVRGTVSLEELVPETRQGDELLPATVRVVITLEGASPGEHAVHVHETGDCSDPEAKSAGGHFNPGGAHQHGNHDAVGTAKHPGDFGNVTVGPDGRGTKSFEVTSVQLETTDEGVLGRAVVVHAKADEFTQPVGNAGGRQACGRIVAK